MKSIALALGLGALVAGAGPARAEAPPAAASVHVPFLEGRPFAEVKKRARAEKKAILLDVVASWCGPCKLMDRTTFSDASVVDWSKKRVVAYRVDAEKGEGRRVAERYAVRSYPTVVFLDADGNEIDRLSGAFQADAFKESGDRILKGDAPLARGLADLKASWTYDKAYGLARELAARNDLRRLRPIVSRMVEEDPDLARTETTEIFTYLAAIEDVQAAVRPETADLLATYLPRLSPNEPRRGLFAVVLARHRAAEGAAADVRALVETTTKTFGELSPYSPDLFTALGKAEAKANHPDAALAAFKKAADAADKQSTFPGDRGGRHMDLAEHLHATGKIEEAKAAMARAVEVSGGDPAILTRASTLALALKNHNMALDFARKAAAASQNEDPAAQAALGAALQASGDAAGAAAAYQRAADFAPENADYRKHLADTKKSRAAPKPS